MIYAHACRYDLTHESAHLRSFLQEVLWVAQRCEELGLSKESGELSEIVSDALGGDARLVEAYALVPRVPY